MPDLTPIKFKYGKDQESQAGLEVDGEFFTNLDLIYALVRVLMKKGVLTKAELKAELFKL